MEIALYMTIFILVSANIVQFWHNKQEKKALKERFRGEGKIEVANETKTNGVSLDRGIGNNDLSKVVGELKKVKNEYKERLMRQGTESDGRNLQETNSVGMERVKEEDCDDAY